MAGRGAGREGAGIKKEYEKKMLVEDGELLTWVEIFDIFRKVKKKSRTEEVNTRLLWYRMEGVRFSFW